MNMQQRLFELALGIEDPMFIDKIEFDKVNGELHIHINFKRGGKFACSICGKKECSVHDTTEKTWRHLNFFQYKCFIHFRTPVTKCDDCGAHLFVPLWGRTQSGFTILFEALILTLAKEMPISKIAEITGEHDTRIWRIVATHVKKAYSEKDFSKVTKVGIDETSSKKGHKYVSIFVDMQEREILFATEGKDAKTIEKFALELPKHNGDADKITEVSLDMSKSFILGTKTNLKNASITFDKFHVVKHLNEAIDEIRKNEQVQNPLLKGSRFVWLKNPSNLTVHQTATLKTLSKENKKLAKSYQMKLTFQDIYRTIWDSKVADIAIQKWLSWAVRSRLEPIKKFARLVKSHYAGILRFFDSRLTAGISEGINSRIQEIKRRAKGYRNINNFITMIYVEGANLKLPAF
jgi:transposase